MNHKIKPDVNENTLYREFAYLNKVHPIIEVIEIFFILLLGFRLRIGKKVLKRNLPLMKS